MIADLMYQPTSQNFLRGRNPQLPGKRNSCKTMALGGKKSCAKRPEAPPPGQIITQMFDVILIQKDISKIFLKNNVDFFLSNIDLLGNRCNSCEPKQVLKAS